MFSDGIIRDRILRELILDFSPFSPDFAGGFPIKLQRKPLEKGKKPQEKIQKIQWRRRAEIADFCPLSWSNVS